MIDWNEIENLEVITPNDLLNLFTLDNGEMNSRRMRWRTIKNHPKVFNSMVNYFDTPIDVESESVSEALYRIVNNIKREDIPVCKECGQHPVVFRKYKLGYSQFCCVECSTKYNNRLSHEASLQRQMEKKPKEYTKDNIEEIFRGDEYHLLASGYTWKDIKSYDERLYNFFTTYFDEPIVFEDEKPSTVVYRIVHDIKTYPTCKYPGCNKRVRYDGWDRGFAEFCSYDCRGKSQRTESYEIKQQKKIHGAEIREGARQKREALETFRNTEFNTREEVLDYLVGDDGVVIAGRCDWSHIKYMVNLYDFMINWPSETVDIKRHKAVAICYMIMHNMREFPKCPICGKEVEFEGWDRGFNMYCSHECRNSELALEERLKKMIATTMERYNVPFAVQSPIIRERTEKTCMDRYNYPCTLVVPSIKKKIQDKIMELYNVEHISQSSIIQQRKEETCMKNNGVRFGLQTKKCIENAHTDEAEHQRHETKKHKGCFRKSSLEDKFEDYLFKEYPHYTINRNYYNDERYPHSCDFYIKELDLFIELQGFVSHGPHPFDPTNQEDLDLFYKWGDKASESRPSYYDYQKNWTIVDVEKRMDAWRNNLNFLEIFSNNIDEVIESFNKYLENGVGYGLYCFDK